MGYHVGEGAASGDVDLGAIFVKAACGGEVLECQFWALRFEQFESFEEVLIGPLFFLELPNSASYQQLASSSPGTTPPARSSDFARPTIRSHANARLGTDAPAARGLKNPPHTAPKNLLRSSRTSQRGAIREERGRFGPWRRRA